MTSSDTFHCLRPPKPIRSAWLKGSSTRILPIGQGSATGSRSGGLQRHRASIGGTVVRCLDALGSLVQKDNGRWVAVEPVGSTAQWFAVRKTKQTHWSDRLASIKLYLPNKSAATSHSLTIAQAAVFAELRSFQRKGYTTITVAGLRTLLNGIDKDTIHTALTALRDADLIRFSREARRLRVKLLPITAKHADLFHKSADNDVTEKADKPDPPERLTFSLPLFEQIHAHCVAAGIPLKLAAEITELCGRFPNIDFEYFRKLSRAAEQDHRKNCLSGTYNAKAGKTSHHGHLLRYKLKEILKRLEQSCRQQAALYPSLDELERYRAERAKEEQILADPLHPLCTEPIAERDITSRVEVSLDEAEKLLEKILAHTAQHIQHKHPDLKRSNEAHLDKLVQLTVALFTKVTKSALHHINRFYHKILKAPPKDFHEAINAALAEAGLKPVFHITITEDNAAKSLPVTPQATAFLSQPPQN